MSLGLVVTVLIIVPFILFAIFMGTSWGDKSAEEHRRDTKAKEDK